MIFSLGRAVKQDAMTSPQWCFDFENSRLQKEK